eukprot:1190639-Prorocentrum_minimum.AAC.1
MAVVLSWLLSKASAVRSACSTSSLAACSAPSSAASATTRTASPARRRSTIRRGQRQCSTVSNDRWDPLSHALDLVCRNWTNELAVLGARYWHRRSRKNEAII